MPFIRLQHRVGKRSIVRLAVVWIESMDSMSNRNKWAHWARPERDKYGRLKQWALGVVSLALGSFLLLAGWQGLLDNVLWYRRFSAFWGKPVTAPTVSLFLIGGVFFIAGVLLLVVHDKKLD